LSRKPARPGNLNHPTLVTVYDIGRENGVSFGVSFIVSELVEGESLCQIVSRGTIPYKRALEIAAQIADG
jgi:serine/threonine protein kinase